MAETPASRIPTPPADGTVAAAAGAPVDARAELAGIVDDLRRHLEWLADSGIRFVRREPAATRAGAASDASRRAPFQGTAGPPSSLPQPAGPAGHARPDCLAPRVGAGPQNQGDTRAQPPARWQPPAAPREQPATAPSAARPATGTPVPLPPAARPAAPSVAGDRAAPPAAPAVRVTGPAAPVSPLPARPAGPAPAERTFAPMQGAPAAGLPPAASAATPSAASFAAVTAARPDAAHALRVIREELGECQRCKLGGTRTRLVFGQGNPHAEILFVGEGPGEDEDLSGEAFVGRAGQLLTKMIEAMGLRRDDVFICNIVKCRPPGNRRPEPEEIETCRPFVERQIRAVAPKVIVALGATAAQALLRTDASISRLRNHWHDWSGIPVMPTFHPSYLLRAPQEKGKAWDDLKLVLARMGREIPSRK